MFFIAMDCWLLHSEYIYNENLLLYLYNKQKLRDQYQYIFYRQILCAMDFDSEDSLFQNHTSNLNKYAHLQRPMPEFIMKNPKETLYLMNIDVVSGTKKKRQNQGQGIVQTEHQLIIIYCATKEGHSVCVNVGDFYPYFYTPFPTSQHLPQNKQECEIIRKKINALFVSYSQEAVVRISIVEAMNIMNYHPNSIKKDKKYIKIEFVNQNYLKQAKYKIQQGTIAPGLYLQNETFEANVQSVVRFMADKKLGGMGWFKLKPDYQFLVRNQKKTGCQIQIQTYMENIQVLPSEGQWAILAPLRILSFSIQCAAQQGLPNASRDPIVQIACICKSTDKNAQDYRIVFALKGASPILNIHLPKVENQKKLLQSFEELVICYDPDFLIGYDMIDCDFKYLLERAKKLKLHYGHFERDPRKFLKQSPQIRKINIKGRIQLDMLSILKKNRKLSSYKLHDVCIELLNIQEEHLQISQAIKFYENSMNSRARLAANCLVNADIPLKLAEKLSIIWNYSEMARVSGVPFRYFITKGPQIKIFSQILREAKEKNYIVPTSMFNRSKETLDYESLRFSKPGFYKEPITKLHFNWHQQRIIINNNLCYTTLLAKDDQQIYSLAHEQYIRTPDGHLFVKQNVKEGLLPCILKQLMSKYQKCKKQRAQTTDSTLRKILDSRQIALKTTANSLSSFVATEKFTYLPSVPIAESIGAYSNEIMEKTKQILIQNFGAKIIFTDKYFLMVEFPLKNNLEQKSEKIRQSMDLCGVAARTIFQNFNNQIKLACEKVYYPLLIVSDSRYAGIWYNQPQIQGQVQKKGMDTLKRDNCLLMEEMVEKVLQILLSFGNKQKLTDYIKQTIRDLLQNKITYKLVFLKAPSPPSSQQNSDNVSQQKATVRKCIPFVRVKTPKKPKQQKSQEKEVNPLNVIKQSESVIDYDHYIKDQLKPLLEKLLLNTEILPFDIFNSLFQGEHTRHIHVQKISPKSPLGKFLKTQQRCLRCKVQCSSVICKSCQGEAKTIEEKKKEEADELREQINQMDDLCRTHCPQSFSREIVCSNYECPRFYQRIQYKKQLMDLEKVIQSLDKWFASKEQ